MTTSEAADLPTGRSNGHANGAPAGPAAAPVPVEPVELAGTVEPVPDGSDVLARLKDSALDLLAGLDRAPRLLRIKADRVELEVEWPTAGTAVTAAVGATTVAAPAGTVEPAAEPPTARQYLTAHMVGVFYRAPQPGADPFVAAGDVINRGQQVGIIEAMKLMLPVEADLTGRVTEVLVSDGAAVEYGDRLFAVEPTDS